jgi:hypothetical protein
MLNVQKFLRREPDGLEKLKNLYAIDAKRHTEYPNLVLLKYNQIESDFKEPIVQECRGIILDEANDWKVVCYTFKKFFNVQEPLAAKIDWSTAEVQEKLDGSLCQLFHYDGHWHVATSGTPDASGQVGDFGKTFKELFWETWNKLGYDTNWLGSGACYAFELTGSLNRVVVDYKEASLTLIGNRIIGKGIPEDHLLEFEPVSYATCPFNLPSSYPLKSIEDCVKAAEALNPLENEGFVVVDANFNRVKIKSPAYVMLHHAKDSLSKKRMCEIVRKGESEEFRTALDSFPALKDLFGDIEAYHQHLVFCCKEDFNAIKHIEDQKEFALEANKYPFASILFQMRKTGLSAAQCLASPKMTINNYMQLIGVK